MAVIPDTSIIQPSLVDPCCDTPGPSSNAGVTPIMDRTVLAEWVASCEGGGSVPSATDVVDSESWDPAIEAAAVYTPALDDETDPSFDGFYLGDETSPAAPPVGAWLLGPE